jgi:2-keto-3-deoxy-L-rhamnonate aldolase RhmA
MSVIRAMVLAVVAYLLSVGQIRAQQAPAAPAGKLYNTAKQKLKEGQSIIGSSVYSPDPNIYCAMANAGFDFLWIERQHSTLEFADISKMIFACKGASAMPFLRVPDATESEIQKATDIGILGIIVPTVETAEKAQAAVQWAKYPPFGRRSQGESQAPTLYGRDYRQTANDNMMVVIMIESPAGVANLDKIVAVPGIDVIFVGSGDLASFSGYKQGSPEYEALLTKIEGTTLKAGLKLGGPQGWKESRKGKGYTFFQGGGSANNEVRLIQLGAKVSLGLTGTSEGRGPNPDNR